LLVQLLVDLVGALDPAPNDVDPRALAQVDPLDVGVCGEGWTHPSDGSGPL
jgi:hypothetical protein